MKIFGDGRIALLGDAATAERLAWGLRRRSRPDPEILLKARHGDARREPWITPGWHDPAVGLESLRLRSRRRHWSYLGEPPGVVRYLERLAQPPVGDKGCCLALAGLGRVGGVAATALALTPSRVSGIRELLISDVDAANQERWLLELGSIARWRSREPLPRVRPTALAEIFSRCDVFLFAATDSVPPLGTQGDVRMMQFQPNRATLRPFLDQARTAGYTGLFFVVSDPVELLAQAAFHDSNRDGSGAFTGDGLAPERIAGLGLGVMWGRALGRARQQGWEQTVARFGAAYGPHGPDVVAFDDVHKPSRGRSEVLTRAAREGNVSIRNLGHLPYVGPGVSSVGLMVPPLLAGDEVLSSVLIDGVYFGAPARLDWGVYPTPQPLAGTVWGALSELHARMKAQARSVSLLWPDRE
ncbi:MAG TPA: hypothetical protein VMT45_09190 [Thermoanaerobaculaceae bacterium]|nr:hypothetical protein [Thermoanaerobaculaceae bacterium]